MQTTMSLQEEPRGENKGVSPFSAEEPRAQTGLRGGKLATHYARFARGLPQECRKRLISCPELAINRAMTKRRIETPRQPGITARLATARHPI
jgi:hypothetical protein